ncbi:MAG: hypothetical protein AB1611_02000 [bacterium]
MRVIDLSSINTVANLSYTFHFLDHTFTISTNKSSALIYFEKMYANFLVKTSTGGGHIGRYYVIDEPALSEQPFILADDKIYPCPKAHMLPGYAHNLIINSVMAKIKSHLLFHAAAVSWQGQGVIILGSSGQGKSTLAIELIRQGFKFFTDEITCIHRENHLLYPFPRTLGVRTTALQLFKDFNLSNLDSLPMISGEGKTVMHVSDVPGIQLSDPCLPKYVIILSSFAEEGSEDRANPPHPARQDYTSLYLAVDRFDEKMISKLQDFPGITEINKIEGGASPVIQLTVKTGSCLLPEIKNLCYHHQVALFDITKERKKRKADFSQEPHLIEIRKSRALFELLRSFRGGQESSIFKDNGAGIASMTLLISSLLENAKCYRLTAGRLEDMAGLLKNLVSEN